MKKMHLSLLALTLATSLSVAMAEDVPKVADAGVASTEERAGGVIQAIDPATREITIKGDKGRIVQIRVDESVKNFAQLKVGDRVQAEYKVAVALALRKGGEGIREDVETSVQASAPQGDKPGGYEARRQTLVANVLKVDHKTGIATLKGPKGRVVDVKIDDPAVLRDIKQGDQVVAVITEEIAVAVTPAH